MSYMHSHKVIHRDLKPQNILLDEFLNPKISDFGLSKITDFLSISMNIQSQRGLKGTPIYMAPEILLNENYSTASDVYAFAFILYELFTLESPYEGFNMLKIIKSVSNGYRPTISDNVSDVLRSLIERCWSQEPENRPSFAEIVDEIKNGDDYFDELIDRSEFDDYADFIDESESSFDSSKQLIHFSDFLKLYGRNKDAKKVILGKEEKEENSSMKEEIDLNNRSANKKEEINNLNNRSANKKEEIDLNGRSANKKEEIDLNGRSANKKEEIDLNGRSANKKEEINLNGRSANKKEEIELKSIDSSQIEDFSLKIHEKETISFDKKYPQKEVIDTQESRADNSHEIEKPVKIKETDPTHLLYPFYEFVTLNKECRKLVEEAEYDPIKQFKVAQSLIEGKNNFPLNIALGKQYLELSFSKKHSESIIYYVKMLIKGEIVPRSLTKASQILIENEKNIDSSFFALKGKISRKEKKYSEALKLFDQGMKLNNCECIYEYAKSLFLGQGVKKNDKKAIEYFKASSEKGNLKSNLFLAVFSKISQNRDFKKLNSETQFFFVKKSIKNMDNNNLENIFKQIKIQPHQTDMLFFNNSFKSNNFHSFLSKFETIMIEIQYPSQSFDKTLELLSKIQSKKIKHMNIGVSFASLPVTIGIDFEPNISHFSLNNSFSKIPKKSFYNCPLKMHLTIPSSVTSIEDSAFENSESLEQVIIPSSVTSIGESAFKGCRKLSQVIIPSSVTSIESHTFENCSSLKQVTIPLSVTSINSFAFYGCSSLTNLMIPHSVTSIGDSAFEDSKSLRQVTVPSSVASIGESAFKECKNLLQFIIPSSVTSIESSTFKNCSSLNKITIPSSVTLIKSSAFYGCKFLVYVEIPSSVTIIENNAFGNCLRLANIAIPSHLTKIDEYTFENCPLRGVVIPKSVTSIEKYAFSNCKFLKSVTFLTNSLTSIGDGAFNDCHSLTNIKIPSSVTSIEPKAFYGCKLLSEITFESPSSISSIGFNAFRSCISLVNIAIPSLVTSIGSDAFNYCTSLINITIPSSVASIESGAFSDCESLSEITFETPSSLTSICKKAFENCEHLKNITIPSSVTSIGSAFSNCSSLSKITFEAPSSVITIAEYAFSKCAKLKDFSIPSSVTFLGNNSFYYCISLTKITIPSSIKSIEFNTFYECHSLASVSFQNPSSLISIGSSYQNPQNTRR